jgi:hypothetical protein
LQWSRAPFFRSLLHLRVARIGRVPERVKVLSLTATPSGVIERESRKGKKR